MTGKTTNQPENQTCIQKTVIWHSGRKFNIYNLYHHPNNKLQLLFESMFKNTIVAGDFNSHSPTWGYKDLDIEKENVSSFVNVKSP